MRGELSFRSDFTVDLIDHMGSDNRVVQAARVSTGKDGDEDGAPRLIKYLLRNGHWSPFQHVYFTFRSEIPIFLARQIMRHQHDFNEMSLRYSEALPRVYTPKTYNAQSPTMKQGRLDIPMSLYQQAGMRQIAESLYQQSWKVYHAMLEAGTAREQCREVLPVAFYTVLYTTMNLRSLIHFLGDRQAVGAQTEAQVYASQIRELVKDIVPVTFQALEELNES